MEQYIKFCLENDFYDDIFSSTDSLSILGDLLIRDGRNGLDSFRKNLLIDSITCFGGNLTSLVKENGSIKMTSILFEDEEVEEPFLKIKKDQLLKILDEWEGLIKKRPQEIIISQKGEEFFIEGKD